MRTRCFSIIFVSLWLGFLPLSAQVLVSTNRAITQDTLLTAIQRNTISSKTIIASGQAVFSSKSGYVRILLSDDYGYDLLVYESSPLVAINGIDNFSNMAIETAEIPSNLALTNIRVEIQNAELRNLSVDVPTTTLSQTQQQTRNDRIALINSNLRSQKALWVAGETTISQMSFEEKKKIFGGSVPDLQGFEYYIGGIFELHSDDITPTPKNTPKSSPFVSSFDWRNRHGANKPSSPYYNGVNGWLTPAKNQENCGSCGIFSVIGAVEALTNLYYNRFLNKNLSEQEIVSCFRYGNCDSNRGWNPGLTIDYIVTNGVSETSCFPYTATDLPCSNKCLNPTEKIRVSGRVNFGTNPYPRTEESLKRMIIKYGPLSGGIYSWGHAMTLSGYGTIKAGDIVYDGPYYNRIVIQPNDPRINEIYWVFKNSYTDWGDNGWGNIKIGINDIGWTHAVLTPITSLNYTETNRVCEDRDGDGYYNWGIGPKPASCPPWAPDEPDGDDSNPLLGPMDEYGNCAINTPSYFTNASVSVNGTSITVNTGGVSDCTIALTRASDSWQSYFEIAKNVSSHTFTNLENRLYNVTITKHNYIPYQGTANVNCLTINFNQNVNLIDRTVSGCNINAQNFTVSNRRTLILIGFNINLQNVIIQSGSKLILIASGEVTFGAGFDAQTGAEVETR
jgi:hypothetical protein